MNLNLSNMSLNNIMRNQSMKSFSKDLLICSSLVLISLLLLTSCGIQPGEKSNHLLLSLDFEEQNSTPFSDNPANQPEFCTGINGKGLDLVNSTLISGVRVSDTTWFSNNKDFSISVWIKTTKITSDTTIIISNSDFKKELAGIYGKRRTNNGFTL